jgi:3',5'-cyclic AMP phosphodiesterase CpdA
MTRILHLSDLHFGRVEPGVAQDALDLATGLAPDGVVISGDLTQRARADQFAAARAFVDRMPQPVLVVPGNHDMPLWNLPLRLLAPFRRYIRAFGAELEPSLSLPGAVVQGVNTANPLVWKAGLLRADSLARLTRTFSAAPPQKWRIAVLHHAPVPAADGTPADIAEPAEALHALAQTGAQVVLSGHTHMPHWGAAGTQAGMLFLQVGTAISTRRKTDANDLSLIELDAGGVTLRSWLARPGQTFVEGPTTRFVHGSNGWSKG